MTNHLEISQKYSDFLDAFTSIETENFDFKNNEISKAIYFHVFKMRCASWKQKILFNRRKRTSISEFFQDIVALYLKIGLGNDYEIILEEKAGKFQPDILIKYNDSNSFIIEVKTTIGWNRNFLNEEIQHRIKELATAFQIDENKVLYIFLSPWNVNRDFALRYWDIENNRPQQNPPTDFPYNRIKPLLTEEDPYYWTHENGFDRQSQYKTYTDEEIMGYAESRIVTSFEGILAEIIDKTRC